MIEHRHEISIYWTIWIGAVFYSIYKVKVFSDQTDQLYKDDFEEGWSIVGRQKDCADYEWETVKHLLHSLIPWCAFHLVFSEYLKTKYIYTRVLHYFYIIETCFYIIINSNTFLLIIILYQPVCFKLFSTFRSKLVIWLCAVLNLILLHYFKEATFDEHHLNIFGILESQHFATVLAVYWVNLRCISYCLNQSNSDSDFISILAYCLYLPLLYTGPIILYDDFQKSRFHSITLAKRIETLFFNILRFVFWYLVTEFLLHFIYVNAISFQPSLVENFDSWTLYGFGYSMGQFFHLKYVVMYGLSTSLAKFESIPVPDTPKCIGRIHLYSDMWRYFDQGLYNFLLRYIYIPIKNFPHSPTFLASFACFAFIYIWHGFLQTDILLWTALNYIGITLENLFRIVYKNYFGTVNRNINSVWKRRIGCLVAAPLLAVSAISNFYFFGGKQIGDIFVARLVNGDFKTNLVLILSLYCCGQVAVEVKSWQTYKLTKIRKCSFHKF